MKKLTVLVLLAFAGCSTCAGKAVPTEPIERVLPKGAVGALVVPSLGGAGEKIHVLESLKVVSFASQLQGFTNGKAYADAIVKQFGFDFRDPKQLELAGLDAKRAGAMVVMVTGQIFVVLPVRDEARFKLAMTEVARQRLGAPNAEDKKLGEVEVHTFASKTEPKLAYAVAHGFALITDGEGAAKLPGMVTMPETDSIASDTVYKAELAHLPSSPDVVAYLPTGTPALMHAPVTMAIATMSLSASGVSVSAIGHVKRGSSDLDAVTVQPNVKDLSGFLPNDAFLVARYTGNPVELEPYVRLFTGRYLNRAFSEAGFDLKKEVLEQLQPGVAVSLSLAERPPLDQGMPSLDLRRTNPFTYVHLSGAAQVKSKDVMVPTLEKIAAIAPKFGAEMTLKERADGQKAMLTTYAQGEGVHFAPKDDLLFFASPVQRLDALVKSDGKSGPTVKLNDEAAVNVNLDLRRLSASVRALPESAWGLGGFAIKATTVRWLDATDDLQNIAVSLGAKEQRVHAKLELSLGPAK